MHSFEIKENEEREEEEEQCLIYHRINRKYQTVENVGRSFVLFFFSPRMRGEEEFMKRNGIEYIQ